MYNNNFKIVTFSITLVLLLSTLVFGATYSFFTAGAISNNAISGGTYSFDASLVITDIKSDSLIPLSDSLIGMALSQSNVCVDINGNDVCAIYKLELTNRGLAQNLNGYLRANNSSNYSTSNLKYQLFTLNNGTYSAISDIGVISPTVAVNNYLKLNNENMIFTLNDGRTTNYKLEYYLVIWLSNINENQTSDMESRFVGEVVFTSTTGEQITADFIN